MSPVVSLQSSGKRTPFFWVHGEQSSAVLASFLGPDQPFHAVLHQSHDGHAARFTRMEDIAGHYVEGVRRIQAKGPYRLGGYCVGATLAFEMAQQLRWAGQEVELLLMLDPPVTGPGASPLGRITPASTTPDTAPSPPSPDSSFGGWLARQFRQMARLRPRQKLAYAIDGTITRSRAMVGAVLDKLSPERRSPANEAAVTRLMRPERRVRYINAVHYRAKLGYIPKPYPGPVVVLQTDGGCRDPETVWGPLAGGGLRVIHLPCRHTEVAVDPDQMMVLARQVKACLEAVDAAG